MAFFMNSFKYLIFLINLIFFGLGLFLAYECFKRLSSDVVSLDAALKQPIYLLLIVTLVIVFISFIGCCGTCYENPCMIKTYAFLILVCCILQIAVVFMFAKLDTTSITEGIKSNLIANYDTQPQGLRKGIQLIQQNYECCGMQGQQDYGTAKIPNSCCGQFEESVFGEKDPQVGKCQPNDLIKVPGCQDKLVEVIKANSQSVLIAIGCVFGLQILVVILSCVLSKSIREQYNVV